MQCSHTCLKVSDECDTLAGEDRPRAILFTGAAIAVEDGVALARALSKITSKEELPMSLAVFQGERIERASQMQEASLLNSKLWHFPDGPLQQARDAAMMPEVERRPFSHSPNQWSDPTTQMWCFGYDAEKAIDKAWAQRGREKSRSSTVRRSLL